MNINCPYGSRFDACICVLRHNVAVETDGDESHCAYPACAECSAVKCYLEYRKKSFEKRDKELVEENKELDTKKNGLTWKDMNGRTVIAIGVKYKPKLSLPENVDHYIMERFIRTYQIIKENNIKSYDELLKFIQYKSKNSVYIFIRDNRKGLEVLFKHNPLQE